MADQAVVHFEVEAAFQNSTNIVTALKSVEVERRSAFKSAPLTARSFLYASDQPTCECV